MAIEDIGKNALQVLEKRYLAKDAEGNHTEDVAGLFRRIMMKTRILLRWRTAFTS